MGGRGKFAKKPAVRVDAARPVQFVVVLVSDLVMEDGEQQPRHIVLAVTIVTLDQTSHILPRIFAAFGLRQKVSLFQGQPFGLAL